MQKRLAVVVSLLTLFLFTVSATSVFAASNTSADSKKVEATKNAAKKVTTKATKDTAATPFKGTVNINKATKKELMQLPGIGETKADEIIKTRKKLGKFKSVDDLLQVKGIGDTTLKALKKFIKL